jgi:hypothetical protein
MDTNLKTQLAGWLVDSLFVLTKDKIRLLFIIDNFQ